MKTNSKHLGLVTKKFNEFFFVDLKNKENFGNSERFLCKVRKSINFKDQFIYVGDEVEIDNIDFLSGAFSPIQMNGQEVYKFAVREVPIILEKLLKKMNYTSDEIDWLVLNQANQRILDYVGERLKIPGEKILSNLEKYGNTSAATIPLVMDEASRNNRIKQNDIIATSGFGAGLSWGAALIKWG